VVHKKSEGASASARTSKVKKIKDGDLDDVKVCHSFVYIFLDLGDPQPHSTERGYSFVYCVVMYLLSYLFT
jgi:hypothetical protein